MKLRILLGCLMVCFGLSLQAAPPGVNGPQQTLILTVAYEKGDYQVMDAQVVNAVFPVRLSKSARQLAFALKNKQGEVLAGGSVDAPQTLRSVLGQGGEHGHDWLEQDSGAFVVRYPYQQGMAVLSLIEKQNGAGARSVQAVPAKNIEFSHLLAQ